MQAARLILITVTFVTCHAKCPSISQNCPQVNPQSCFDDKQAYDFGVCCPSCIPVKDVIQTQICSGQICKIVTCIPQTISDCKTGQVFVPEGSCSCCDVCRDKPVPRKCNEKCLWNCVDEEYQTCLSAGKAYVPADGDCNCCASCRNVSDTIKTRKNCPEEDCELATCEDQTPDKCIKNQVLVPRDGRNFCCDTCVFIKEIDDCTYN